MRETWSTTLRCRRPCVPPAQVAVGIECDIRNESNICSSSRDLTRCPSTSTVCVCRSFTGEAGRQIWPLFRCTSERIMAPTPKTGLAAGLNKGHVVTKRDKKVKPSHSKGVSMQHIHRQLLHQTRSLVFVQTSAYPNSHSGCGLISTFCMRSSAAAETRQANKAHP